MAWWNESPLQNIESVSRGIGRGASGLWNQFANIEARNPQVNPLPGTSAGDYLQQYVPGHSLLKKQAGTSAADATTTGTGTTTDSAAASLDLIDQLLNRFLPAQQPYDPVMLMNAQSQFMAPYLSHLQYMSPEVKASYAQQAMTFPLAYQIQQQVQQQSNVNDLRSQLLGSLLGTYIKNSMAPTTGGLTLSGQAAGG